jgi:hypothetical protein
MTNTLWGLKTNAIFDAWSIEHILCGLSVGKIVLETNRRISNKYFGLNLSNVQKNYANLISILFLAYFWEAIEHYLETGLVGDVASDWFQGVEFWANHLVADPLMMILGYYLAQRFPRLVNPAKVCSIVWFFVHVLVFPHSMYLYVYFAST